MKVLIAGGGIGGLTAALCLTKDGHQIEVFERARSFAEAGAGIQLSPNCSRVLHHLDLEKDLHRHAFLPTGAQIRQWHSGKLISENPLGDFVTQQYGFPYYHIHRGDLLKVLVDACQQDSNITLHVGRSITHIEQTKNSAIAHTNNEQVEGDILIGADGIHSTVRSELWGNQKPNFTGNVAWRALVPATSLPKDLIKPTSTVWWGPNKHFVHYYVKSGDLINCVCVVEKQGWEIESWTEQGDIKELKQDFSNWHEDIQLLIDNADPESLFKWALYDRPPMKRWGIDRVTLLGDACHPTLPFMAQGAAMAIEDGAVLANCLRASSDIPQSLHQYENLRQSRTAGIQKGSRRNATVFHLSGIKAWLRDRAAKQAGTRTLHNLFNYNALEQQP